MNRKDKFTLSLPSYRKSRYPRAREKHPSGGKTTEWDLTALHLQCHVFSSVSLALMGLDLKPTPANTRSELMQHQAIPHAFSVHASSCRPVYAVSFRHRLLAHLSIRLAPETNIQVWHGTNPLYGPHSLGNLPQTKDLNLHQNKTKLYQLKYQALGVPGIWLATLDKNFIPDHRTTCHAHHHVDSSKVISDPSLACMVSDTGQTTGTQELGNLITQTPGLPPKDSRSTSTCGHHQGTHSVSFVGWLQKDLGYYHEGIFKSLFSDFNVFYSWCTNLRSH